MELVARWSQRAKSGENSFIDSNGNGEAVNIESPWMKDL